MAFSTNDPLVDATAGAAADLSAADGCLGRTCLKWGPDGKLTAFDLQMVMQKLRLVDHQLVGQEEGEDASATLQNN
ncbi:hypothetical protein [Synechococcus sp. CCY 9618]|uniref:hypothetical protein n=1 Tax=Synechococcus sp. CCY 9618 TaxID=2815602 RepID=UPI001C23CCD7|nr:hypothetical protein [Synechococcus sp. CCY 9618]